MQVVFHLAKFSERNPLAISTKKKERANFFYQLKPIFHLANLFARTDKKVATVPTCLRRICSPASFNQSRFRILVFASREQSRQVENRLREASYVDFVHEKRRMDIRGWWEWGGACYVSRLKIVKNFDSLLKIFNILKSSIQVSVFIIRVCMYAHYQVLAQHSILKAA